MYQELLHAYLKNLDSGIALSLLKGPPGRLLDLGCGSGEDLRDFRSRGWEAVGLDPFQHVDDACFVKGTAERLPFRDQSYDAVTSILVLPHVRGTSQALRETYRILRSGGQALFVLFTSSPLNFRIAVSEYRLAVGPPMRTRLYSSRSFERLLRSAGFRRVADARTDFLPWMSGLLPKRARRRLLAGLAAVDPLLYQSPFRFFARKLVVKAVRP